MSVESILNLLSLMGHLKVILPGCFSNLYPSEILFHDEPLYPFSQLKFDGEDGTSITNHIFNFLKFCEFYEINDIYFSCVPFFLTLEGHVNR